MRSIPANIHTPVVAPGNLSLRRVARNKRKRSFLPPPMARPFAHRFYGRLSTSSMNRDLPRSLFTLSAMHRKIRSGCLAGLSLARWRQQVLSPHPRRATKDRLAAYLPNDTAQLGKAVTFVAGIPDHDSLPTVASSKLS